MLAAVFALVELEVPLQAFALGITPPAVFTLERLYFRMHGKVTSQVSILNETLATFLALVRFYS